MEDDLMKRFGGERLGSIMDKVGVDDSLPIDAALVSSSIEKAQKRVEERHFDTRQSVLEYDDVMNQQRELIYSERRKALLEDDVHDSVLGMMDAAVDLVVGRYSAESHFPEEWDLDALLRDMAVYLPQDLPAKDKLKGMSRDEVFDFFKEKMRARYALRDEELGEDRRKLLEHAVILQVVDGKWMDHLDAMDQLRQGIGLRAIGQLNPLNEYKKEAFDMFEAMVQDIQLDVTRLCLLAQITERPEERKNLSSNHDGSAPAKRQPIRKAPAEKVGRNDPCPCGSGKKYKNCCGR